MSLEHSWEWSGSSGDPNDEQFGDIVEQATLSEADGYDAVLVGEPYDGGVIGRAGAREGPAAIREALATTKTHHFDAGPVDAVADLGTVEIPDGESVSTVQDAVRSVAESVHDAAATPVFLGGDGSLTYANVTPLLHSGRTDGGYVTDGGFGDDGEPVGDVEHFDPTGSGSEDAGEEDESGTDADDTETEDAETSDEEDETEETTDEGESEESEAEFEESETEDGAEESGVGATETVETVEVTESSGTKSRESGGSERAASSVGVVSLDAHLDYRVVEGQPTSRTAYRQLLDEGLDALAVLGPRHFETTTADAADLRDAGGEIVTAEEIAEDTVDAADRALDVMAGVESVYVSVDVDVLDATAAPGVSAPTPGGITTRELFRLLRLLASDDRLAGVEIVETAPPLCPDGRTARAAARAVAHALSVQ